MRELTFRTLTTVSFQPKIAWITVITVISRSSHSSLLFIGTCRVRLIIRWHLIVVSISFTSAVVAVFIMRKRAVSSHFTSTFEIITAHFLVLFLVVVIVVVVIVIVVPIGITIVVVFFVSNIFDRGCGSGGRGGRG